MYYYFILIPEPLQKPIKLQPLHLMDQFYTTTNKFYIYTLYAQNFNAFKDPLIFCIYFVGVQKIIQIDQNMLGVMINCV